MNKEELIEKIEGANEKYWKDGVSDISDVEYDKLVEELRKIDPNNDLVCQVNEPVVVGEKIVHKVPMLSLNKVYTKEQLKKWMEQVSRNEEELFLIQPKYDGISGKLEEGKLSTRGNGYEGSNISDKLKMIRIESNKIVDVTKDYVLGEIVITNNDFNTVYRKIKSKSGKTFKNSRNAVSGIVGNEDADFYFKQGAVLTFVDYDKNSFEIKMKEFDEKFEKIEEQINGYDYPMDGIVIKLKDKEYGDSLGRTEHHPKNQIALKFTNEQAVTKLVGIEWGMGKDNRITSVAVFDPVDIQGVTITKASISLTKRSDGGKYIVHGDIAIGDKIVVERAGMVIPYIVNIEESNPRGEIVSIEKCPFCGSDIRIDDNSVVCLNEHCFEGKVKNVTWQLTCLGIFGIGESVIRSIMKKTDIDNLYDFLMIQKKDLIGIDGIGKTMQDNIMCELAKIKCVKASLFLKALNISNLGESVSKTLLKSFNLDYILKSLTIADICGMEGIGEITSKNVIEGLNKNRERNLRLLSLFDVEEEKIEEGEKICFTGKSSYTRQEMEDKAREKGFVPVDSVSKDLNILVCADVNSTSSKMNKAKKFGIKIISEQEFFAL